MALDRPTIPLADLLATKLQVVEITQREYKDVIALVRDHEIADSDTHEMINGNHFAELASDDWGIFKTFSSNVSNILSVLHQYELEPSSQEVVRARLKELQNRLEIVPKSLRWKLRARLGEKVRWYELPEGDKEIVDSRVIPKADN